MAQKEEALHWAVPEGMDPAEEERLYTAFREWVDSMGFGYTAAAGEAAGAELVMLKAFYTPDDVKYCMDMPTDEFFTVADFAEKEGFPEEKAFEILQDMARRGNLYHEIREDGRHYYHNEPAAHGIYEFHAGEFDLNWLGKGLYPTMAGGMLQVVYDAGIPFYRCVPADPSLVRDRDVLPDDDLFEMLKGHRRFCVSPCACLDSSREWMGIHNCDHHVGVCLQTDEMADYYLDDLQLGHEVTYEQAAQMLRRNVEKGFALQTTYAKKNEIICSCNLCHCGILQAAKMFPGDAMNSISRYRIEQDREKWTGTCDIAPHCTMQAITYDEDGYPITDDSCIGCGQCVRACTDGSRILVRKSDDEILPLPDDVWGAYVAMEKNRRAKGALV